MQPWEKQLWVQHSSISSKTTLQSATQGAAEIVSESHVHFWSFMLEEELTLE